MNIMSGFQSKVPPIRQAKNARVINASSLPWKYAFARALGGGVVARRWKESPELQQAGINRFRLSDVSLPKTWNPEASQAPWESKQRIASDLARQRAYRVGITSGTGTEQVPDFYGKYTPTLHDLFKYNPYEGLSGTKSKRVSTPMNRPVFQAPQYTNPLLQYQLPQLWQAQMENQRAKKKGVL